MAREQVKVVVSGDIRRAGALVERTNVALARNSDGDLGGAAAVTTNDDDVLLVAITLYGEAGAAFECEVALGQRGSVTKRGRLVTDVALRAYPIKYEDFG